MYVNPFCITLLVMTLCIPASVNSETRVTTDVDTRLLHSRQAVKMFADALIAELRYAMEEGGPERAIKVCHIEAPQIARDVSDTHKWQVGRTSLRYRNPDNAPDAWEETVLKQFEQRKAQGEDISKLEYAEDTAAGYRYMKAIPTKPLCLACHGENLGEEVQATLKEYYPNDNATGFKVGDIRGVFTILQPNK